MVTPLSREIDTHMPQQTFHFDLDAGVDCLAFANTNEDRNVTNPVERLSSYGNLVDFSEQTGQLTVSGANDLRLMAERRPDEAQAVLERAIRFREAIYRVFAAIAADHTPEAEDLDLLNDELRDAMSQTRLVPADKGFDWTWPASAMPMERALWPVARSAAELLISGELDRVRECAAHDCGWLFFDESRNRSRRWCSMQTCGNRAKVDRFRTRRKDANTPQPVG